MPPKPVIIAAAALAIALVVAVAIIGLTAGGGEHQQQPKIEPLPLAAVDAPDADSPECVRLMKELPQSLESGGQTLQRRELADPAPEAAAAWGVENPVVVRCGLHKPADLKPTSQVVEIDGVRWFQATDPGASTWYVVGTPVTVAVTLPQGSGTGIVQDLAKAVTAAMPG